jgi:hypothetical protein
MEHSTPSITLKGTENWNVWKFQTRIALLGRGVFEAVTENPPTKKETDTDGSQYLSSDYKKKDLKAQEIIASRVEDGPMSHILTCENARDMWNKLCSVYEHQSEVSIHMLQKKFFNYTHDGREISTYISGLEEIRTQLKQHKEEISEQMFMTKILMGLPPDFNYFISAWESVPSDKQSVNELVSRLYIEEERMKSQGVKTESAYASQKFQNTSARKFSVTSNNCNICRKQGHLAKDCYLKKNFDLKLCFHCNKPNHKAKDCRQRDKNKENMQQGKVRHHRSAYTSIALIGEEQLMDQDWYADSGASEHMTHSKKWIYNYKELQNPIKIKIANGGVIEAVGHGDIQIKTFDGRKWSEGELKSVLYVPDLQCNLFSISSVTEKGYSFEIERNGCKIIKDNEVKILGKREGKLYKLILKFEENAFLGTYSGKVENLYIWHEKLAHQNIHQVRAILKSHGIEFQDVKEFFCEACILGKQHVLPFGRSTRVAKVPGEIIHADVCGPMEENSIGNSRYFLLLKDDYSHYRSVYFLKNKSEAKSKIKAFLELAASVTGNRIQILRTDQGLEEVNKEVTKFLEDRGIRHQKSCTYTPQQNGRIERENRTVVELARTMLQAKNMKKELWAEAVATAVYVLNLSGTSSVKGKTPFELWFKDTPDLKRLHPFGSEIYVLVPKQHRRKWDVKSKKGIFVGYGEQIKGYRVYFPAERKIEISRNVIFKPDFETHSEEGNTLDKHSKHLSMDDEETNEHLNLLEDTEAQFNEETVESTSIDDTAQERSGMENNFDLPGDGEDGENNETITISENPEEMSNFQKNLKTLNCIQHIVSLLNQKILFHIMKLFKILNGVRHWNGS